jgi:hypothetical protein
MAESGHDVPTDVPLVAEPRGGSDSRRAHRRQPLLHQEPSNGSMGGLDERTGPQRGEGLGEDLLTLPLGPEAALAVLAALARHRIGHVEVPGIGTATLANEAAHQGCSSAGRPSISSRREVDGLRPWPARAILRGQLLPGSHPVTAHGNLRAAWALAGRPRNSRLVLQP